VKPRCHKQSWIAPNAAVIGDVEMAKLSSVWFNATVRGDTNLIVIEEGANIQDGSVLHTDKGVPLIVGRGVTVGHMCMLHGCEIGENTLIGIGSIILNHTKIGKNCLIGANTFIGERKTIPDGSLVMGAPGKVVRTLTEEQIEGIKRNGGNYIANWQRYASGLEEC